MFDSKNGLDVSRLHPELAKLYPFLTVREAAQLMGLTPGTVYTMRHHFPEQLPPAYKVSEGQSGIRFAKAHVLEWCRRRERAAA